MYKAIIADDEPAVLTIIEHFIESQRLPIKVIGRAKNGLEAFDMIKSLRPDFAFLDIQMPKLSGLEVMESSTSAGLTNTKFFIITGYDYFEYAQAALRLGAKDILLKPLDLTQFRDAVSKNLRFEYTDNQLVNSALLYIDEHYSDDISLNNTAGQLFTSPQYLCRVFKENMSITFNKYLNQYRIGKAQELLLHSKFDIKEVALKVGYKNINNFYSQFKLYSGCTPASYMENRGSGTHVDENKKVHTDDSTHSDNNENILTDEVEIDLFS